MEAVDGVTGRPLSICPVKSAGAAKAELAGALQTGWSCQIIPIFPASETSSRDNYVSRLSNAQIITSLFNRIVRPGDDSVRRDSFDASSELREDVKSTSHLQQS